jgi:ATP-binding cassette subfamily B (MDR/TAP) protein 1
VILALYVDDVILISNDVDGLLKQFKSKLEKKFAMTDLGHIQYCLGIQIKRDRLNYTIYMHHAKYIETKLQMFKLEMGKVVATPLEVGLKLTKAMSPQIESKREHMKKVPYQSAVGSLMYCMICIKLDIAYSMGVVSQFLTDPREIHWKAVKRIF